MPLLRIKLIEAEKASALQTAIDAYLVSQSLVNGIRGMAVHTHKAQDGDAKTMVALAHDGLDLPAGAAKVGNLQVLAVEGVGVVAAQAALDLALADAIHDTDAAGDADTFAGDIVAGASIFEAEDVGRKISIGTNERTITAFVSATRATYSGAAITGTGLSVKLRGAEILQPDGVCLDAFKSQDGKTKVSVVIAVNGESL